MISFNAYFTIQLAKPKSVLIYIYSVLNQIGPVDGSNCCINKTWGGDRPEKRETFFAHSY